MTDFDEYIEDFLGITSLQDKLTREMIIELQQEIDREIIDNWIKTINQYA